MERSCAIGPANDPSKMASQKYMADDAGPLFVNGASADLFSELA